MAGKVSVFIKSIMDTISIVQFELLDIGFYTFVNIQAHLQPHCQLSSFKTQSLQLQTKTSVTVSNMLQLFSTTRPCEIFQLNKLTHILYAWVVQMRWLYLDTQTVKYKKWDSGAAPLSKKMSERNCIVSKLVCHET